MPFIFVSDKGIGTKSETFFIVNKLHRIVFANLAFENFVQKPIVKIEGLNFGVALNCMYIKKDKHTCGETYYCEICKIRNAINDCFKNPEIIIQNEFVRDFKLNDEIIFKHIKLMAYYIILNNNPHVAITFSYNNPDQNSI